MPKFHSSGLVSPVLIGQTHKYIYKHKINQGEIDNIHINFGRDWISEIERICFVYPRFLPVGVIIERCSFKGSTCGQWKKL